MIKVKRIYDKPTKADGYRILVDRVWARGLTKADAKIDRWLKEVAPSSELRQWFAHDREKWREFKRRYRNELRGRSSELAELKSIVRQHKKVTLLFSAKDEERNNAVALRDFLADH